MVHAHNDVRAYDMQVWQDPSALTRLCRPALATAFTALLGWGLCFRVVALTMLAWKAARTVRPG